MNKNNLTEFNRDGGSNTYTIRLTSDGKLILPDNTELEVDSKIVKAIAATGMKPIKPQRRNDLQEAVSNLVRNNKNVSPFTGRTTKQANQWAKENAISSGLGDAPIRWLVDDCVKFVEREIRRGNKYDGIIMDPPSYGRGPKGEIWKIEESVFPFIELTTELLSEESAFFLINSYTTGLQPAVLSYMLNTSIKPKFGGEVVSNEIGLPVSENGLVLPCGASGRWVKS